MKKKILIGSSIIILLIVGFIIFKLNYIETVVFEKKSIENEQAWEKFKEKSFSKKSCKLRIKIGKKDNEKKFINYDGDTYIYSVDGNEHYYKYLLEIKGGKKNTGINSKYIILANEKYDYDAISKSVYSNNSQDSIPYQLIYCY